MLNGVLSEMHLLVITPVPPTINLDIVHIMPTPARPAPIMDHIAIELVLITKPRQLELFRYDYFIFQFVEGVLLIIKPLEMELN